MRVQILYFDGCPNHAPALELTREVVAETGIAVEIEVVEVRSDEEAERLRFIGSPSIRVDGVDIEPGADARDQFAMSCRVYEGGGVPARELLRTALQPVPS